MKLKLVGAILLGLAGLSLQSEAKVENTYDILIHAIPHTHLDAGWIENIDTYYNNYIVEIFRTLISELENNRSYRFNWAEVGFLHRWWQESD